jgi:tetratricopeptide (TPR) repeat protein
VRRTLAALAACAGCAHALRTPPPIETIAKESQGPGGRLLAEAEAAWQNRAAPEEAKRAEDLYLETARAMRRDPSGYAGAIRAKAFRIGREKDGGARERLAHDAVAVGQLCQQGIPGSPVCDYWLALALGLQARERSSTAHDALPHMVDLLKAAAGKDESIDLGGPRRLLAIVLLRAPGWPIGPGDPDAALPQAQAAAKLATEYPPNQLALGEALKKNGKEEEARAAYSEALRFATSDPFRQDPDAKGWADDARAALR